MSFNENQKRQLLEHAEKEKPNESCAILYGKNDDSKAIVTEIYFTKNIEESPINFTISNEELIKAYKTAEEKHLEIVGIFHSHPDSMAVPSNTDKRFMESNPVVWVIYSGVSKEFKAYTLNESVKEVTIQTS
ncbi:MAG: peptidase [Crenarchaeota archaeon]|nr:MAG: peptidase [Thermoproteota archaeon]RDJ33425.1 MAG: peptidase [Thermoproteota archaeon]RDJ36051.1 MAG: peptidase [Thermoproteota archaeon]RDJ38379.1 MAG: peptidase [Thermoproteota archaeon]